MERGESGSQGGEALYPGLSGGPGRMAPEEVASHQRARLEGAMVEAVARHGYAGTTLGELVALAGVSKSTFYEHFASKEECFWATFDAIVGETSEEVLAAYRGASGQRGRLGAALEAYSESLMARRDAASLVAVESLCLGRAGAAQRERATAPFERALRECYAEAPGRGRVSEPAIRGVVGGYRQIVYRCLRERHPEALAAESEALAEWILGYQRPPGQPFLPASFFAGLAGAAASEPPEAPGWEEPPNSPRSRRALSQRERIARAAARLAVEKGYANLTVPGISGAAGVSNQTFYEEFGGKQEAFLAAFDSLAERLLGRVGAAFAAQERWPEALGAGLWALLEAIAADPLFARLAFFELAGAGPAGLDRADAAMSRTIALMAPAAGPAAAVPETTIEAIGGGVWSVIQAEIERGRGERLAELAGELSEFALVPFAGGA